jgi:hypothetical protein
VDNSGFKNHGKLVNTETLPRHLQASMERIVRALVLVDLAIGGSWQHGSEDLDELQHSGTFGFLETQQEAVGCCCLRATEFCLFL